MAYGLVPPYLLFERNMKTLLDTVTLTISADKDLKKIRNFLLKNTQSIQQAKLLKIYLFYECFSEQYLPVSLGLYSFLSSYLPFRSVGAIAINNPLSGDRYQIVHALPSSIYVLGEYL